MGTVDSFWIVSIAKGLNPERLAMILQTWDVPGIDGICLVIDAPLDWRPAVVPCLRQVTPSVPFHRATWRNIGCRYAPSTHVAFWDADCALTAPRVVSQIREHLQTAEAVFFAPAWSDEAWAKVFLDGGLAWTERLPTQLYVRSRPTTADRIWAGTVACSRELAVEVSWDDRCTEGWGWEDADFSHRLRARAKGVCVLQDVLTHVWHPRRGCKAEKVANMRRSLSRRSEGVLGWVERARREIAMACWSACGTAIEAAQAQGQRVEDEATVRRLVAGFERFRGWPALAHLAQGHAPEQCIYEPVIGCLMHDSAAPSSR